MDAINNKVMIVKVLRIVFHGVVAFRLTPGNW